MSQDQQMAKAKSQLLMAGVGKPAVHEWEDLTKKTPTNKLDLIETPQASEEQEAPPKVKKQPEVVAAPPKKESPPEVKVTP